MLSGEYILNLLAKANGNEIKLEWRTGLKDNKIESYHRKLIKFFSSKSSNYYKFENRLQISLENLVVKKEKQGTLLWNIFEWYGYSIYDLNGNVDSKNKVFELFDIPYLLNFGGGSVSGAENTLEMADFFNGVVLFKTMMFQNIKEHSKLQILKLYDYLSEIVAYLAMLVLLIFSFTDNLPIKISSKSLNQDKVSICKIRTKIFFAVMFFVINSQNYEVKKNWQKY